MINPRGTDDFAAYLCAKSVLKDAQLELAYRLEECDMAINTTDELLALLYLARFRGVPTSTRDALPRYYQQQGIDPPVPELAVVLPEAALQLAEYILTNTHLEDEELGESLATYHWLMEANLREGITQVLQSFPPGSMLADKQGRYWIRRATMAITRHRFISPVGDDQEKYYKQKYLLNVCLTDEDDVVHNPPKSWLELCASKGMCDSHVDALSSLQSALS